MPAAARVGDFHQCPMSTPMPPPAAPVPHVGGPVQPPGAPTVLIGGQPAAKVGDLCLCALPAPPDSLIAGSKTVMITGLPAARVGDASAHGGKVMAGCQTVIIGG